MNLLSILLQANGTTGTSGGSENPGFGGGMSSMLLFAALIAVFYFFMIRPQQKKQKEIAKMRAAMKTGDRVVTSGGIYGKIKEVNDTNFIIEIAENVRIKVDKGSVFAAADDIPQTK